MTTSSTNEQFGQRHQNTKPCLSSCQCMLLHLQLTTVTETLYANYHVKTLTFQLNAMVPHQVTRSIMVLHDHAQKY